MNYIIIIIILWLAKGMVNLAFDWLSHLVEQVAYWNFHADTSIRLILIHDGWFGIESLTIHINYVF